MPFPTERLALLLSCAACVGVAAPALHAQPTSAQNERIEQQPGIDRRPAAPMLDEVGYAGVLRLGGSGDAIGGSFGKDAIIAAHRTLPVPSYAEVTSLASGRTIVVRIAEQGASAKGRVIDLSCSAIRQLGLSAVPAPIRVRPVTPPQQEQSALDAGQAVAERLPSPSGLLSALRKKLPPASGNVPEYSDCGSNSAPPFEEADVRRAPISHVRPARIDPKAKLPPPVKMAEPAREKQKPPVVVERVASPPVAKVARSPGFSIQVAALSNRAKANVLARSLAGYVETTGGIARVRKGPYATEVAARAALPQIRAKGFADARVIPNEGR